MTDPIPDRTNFRWSIPTTDAALELDAAPGRATLIVGANGSGKSELGLWLLRNSPDNTHWINAHRKIWLQSAGASITSADRINLVQNIAAWSRDRTARYLDHAHDARPNVALFDLLSLQNHYNGRFVELVQAGQPSTDVEKQLGRSPINRLNRILRRGNLSVAVRTTRESTFEAVPPAGEPYPISRMSDGEKAALLLTADVLRAPEGAIQIVDEPERHLHRSISAGLLEGLLADRPDCHFVVLTHDLSLARSLFNHAQVLVTTGCVWGEDGVAAWDLHKVPTTEAIPESLTSAILGARRRVIFVEGGTSSHDVAVYKSLYSGCHIQPSGGCVEVRRNVKGVRSTAGLHWIAAAGIVDADQRTPEELATWMAEGVLCTPFSEIENIFYTQPVLRALATRQTSVHGGDPEALAAAARAEGLLALTSGAVESLAWKLAEKRLKDDLRAQLESLGKLQSTTPDVTLSAQSSLASETAALAQLVAAGDFDEIVKRYPIRDSHVRARVAAAMHFASPLDYENAARIAISDDDDLRVELLEIVGPPPF